MLGKLMLLVTEVAEAAEAVRRADHANFEEELADILIRLLDISGSCGIDLDKAYADKMAYNETRPERHDKKVAL